MNRFTTATSRRLIGIIEDKLARELIGLKIHLCAEQKEHGFRIDHHCGALFRYDFITGADGISGFDGVGHPSAAAIFDAHAQTDDRGL